jgi:hypothetical protein
MASYLRTVFLQKEIHTLLQFFCGLVGNRAAHSCSKAVRFISLDRVLDFANAIAYPGIS